MLDAVTVTERTTRLSVGDSLLLYTDGVTEAGRGAEQYGEERLVGLLSRTPPSSQAIADAVLTDVLEHEPAPSDDIAVLVLTVRCAASGSTDLTS